MRQAKGFGHLIQETDKDNSHYHHQHHDAPAMYNTAYNMKCIITATLTITDQIHDNMATRNEVGQGLTKEANTTPLRPPPPPPPPSANALSTL